MHQRKAAPSAIRPDERVVISVDLFRTEVIQMVAGASPAVRYCACYGAFKKNYVKFLHLMP